MGLIDRVNGADRSNDHHDHAPVDREDLLRLERKIDLALNLLCPEHRAEAVQNMHPAPAPLPLPDLEAGISG